MSLNINVAFVDSVLLADGWHKCDNDTFNVDSYEYLDATVVVHGGGQSGVCATGFSFNEPGKRGKKPTVVAGPLTSILAVKYKGFANCPGK